MFTGLVQTIGRVSSVRHSDGGMELEVECDLAPFKLGESIAVDGACLTVKQHTEQSFVADASTETLEKTCLGQLATGASVHLERALSLGASLGGHWVTGHVDGVGSLESQRPDGDGVVVRFEVPPLLRPFVAPKGSITVHGASLTVNRVDDTGFEVMLVPFTLRETTFASMRPGQPVNLEVDVLAKYVASLMGRPGVDGSGAATPKESDS